MDDENIEIVFENPNDCAAVGKAAEAKRPKRTYKKRKIKDDADFTMDCDKVAKRRRRNNTCDKNNSSSYKTEPAATLVEKVRSRPSRAAAISSRVEMKKSLIAAAHDDEDGGDDNDDADFEIVFKKSPYPRKRRVVKTRSAAKNHGQEKSDGKHDSSDDVTTRKRVGGKAAGRPRKTAKLNADAEWVGGGGAVVVDAWKQPAKKTARKCKRKRATKNVAAAAADDDDDGMQCAEQEDEDDGRGPFVRQLSKRFRMLAERENEWRRVVKEAAGDDEPTTGSSPNTFVVLAAPDEMKSSSVRDDGYDDGGLAREDDDDDDDDDDDGGLAREDDDDDEDDDDGMQQQFVEEEEVEVAEKKKEDEDVHLVRQLSRRFRIPTEELTGVIERDAVPVFSAKFREPVAASMVALSSVVVEPVVGRNAAAAYRVEPAWWNEVGTKSTLKDTVEELTRTRPSWSLSIAGDPPRYVISHVTINAYNIPVFDKSVVLDKYFRASVYVGQSLRYEYCKYYNSAAEIVDLIRQLETL